MKYVKQLLAPEQLSESRTRSYGTENISEAEVARLECAVHEETTKQVRSPFAIALSIITSFQILPKMISKQKHNQNKCWVQLILKDLFCCKIPCLAYKSSQVNKAIQKP